MLLCCVAFSDKVVRYHGSSFARAKINTRKLILDFFVDLLDFIYSYINKIHFNIPFYGIHTTKLVLRFIETAICIQKYLAFQKCYSSVSAPAVLVDTPVCEDHTQINSAFFLCFESDGILFLDDSLHISCFIIFINCVIYTNTRR